MWRIPVDRLFTLDGTTKLISSVLWRIPVAELSTETTLLCSVHGCLDCFPAPFQEWRATQFLYTSRSCTNWYPKQDNDNEIDKALFRWAMLRTTILTHTAVHETYSSNEPNRSEVYYRANNNNDSSLDCTSSSSSDAMQCNATQRNATQYRTADGSCHNLEDPLRIHSRVTAVGTRMFRLSRPVMVLAKIHMYH